MSSEAASSKVADEKTAAFLNQNSFFLSKELARKQVFKMCTEVRGSDRVFKPIPNMQGRVQSKKNTGVKDPSKQARVTRPVLKRTGSPDNEKTNIPVKQNRNKIMYRAGSVDNMLTNKSVKQKRNDSIDKSVIDMTLPMNFNFRSNDSFNTNVTPVGFIEALDKLGSVSTEDLQRRFMRKYSR